jgi:predicted TIM-barrel fold metal-dependent hydrolase
VPNPVASALELVERQGDEVAALRPPGTEIVDAHTHLGLDEDGFSLSLEEHVRQMDESGVARAAVFALNEPDREPAYRAPNDRILHWAEESDGRLVPFVRLSLDEKPLAEAERCVERGARGIKLHPRAQAFRVDDARLEAVFAYAAERRLPVLIHAGRGLPLGMARELGVVADRHPEATLILAHAGIAEQALIGEFANGHPNIYFDTSVWSPVDLLALFAKVAPEQILWASDVPYGHQLGAQEVLLRLMARLGLADDLIRAIMGGTVTGLFAGRRPERLSPPANAATLTISYDRMRIYGYLASAVPLVWTGQGDFVGLMGLALGACSDGDEELATVATLIAGVQALWLRALEIDDLDLRRTEARKAFGLLIRAQVYVLVGGGSG